MYCRDMGSARGLDPPSSSLEHPLLLSFALVLGLFSPSEVALATQHGEKGDFLHYCTYFIQI